MIASRGLWFGLLAIVTLAWLDIGGEAVARLKGNWRIDRLMLTKRPDTPQDRVDAGNAERALVEQITYQKGVNPEWFFLPPAPLVMPNNPELHARTKANPNGQGMENAIWNDYLLAHPYPDFIAMIRKLNVKDLFAFPSFDSSPYPEYRLYPGNDFLPFPWVTDRWGWLGADTGVRKPPHTIRVGILGDSTSHNLYALNLLSFLDAWAKHYGFDVRFEVFSAGRQGLGFDDELAVLEYELAPMGLDYVYEYFAPGFSLQGNAAQMVAFAQLPPGVKGGDIPATPIHLRGEAFQQILAPVIPFSALARSISDLVANDAPDSVLVEPAKPRVVLHLPPGTEGHVVLTEARKDPYFGTLINHLDRFKALANRTHTTAFVSTERVCAWNGMTVRNDNKHLYDVLNGPIFWPFSYADVRKILTAHNDTIKAWAKANGVTVVDVDGRMPARPDLCLDPWHDIFFGPRMRAWLIFQAMIPQMMHDLSTGEVPRANGVDSDAHPYLETPIERINRDDWLAKYDSSEKRSAAGPAK